MSYRFRLGLGAAPSQMWFGVLARCHTWFEVDAEPVGDAVDVVEKGDCLHRVVDSTIIEAQAARAVDASQCYRDRPS
jgi:hypothetical protein